MAFWRNSQPPKSTAAKTLKHFDGKTETSDQSGFHFLALRGNQYKHLVKGLISYYGELKQQYIQSAEHMPKLVQTLPIPFHEPSFLPVEDPVGYQGALASIRDKTRALSVIYNELAASVDTQVITALEASRTDIKTLLKQMDQELGQLTADVDKCRKASGDILREHDAGLALFDTPSSNSFSASNAHQDPFLTHSLASLQLTRQVDLENRQLRSVIQFQKLWQELELKINEALVSTSRTFLEIQLMGDVRLKGEFAGIEEAMATVSPQAEWELFAQPPRVIDAHTPARSAAEASAFPQQDHVAAQPLFSGPLERQKSVTRTFAPFHFVLTPSGFLHQFDAGGLTDVTHPEAFEPHLSIFLPEFTLSPASAESDPKGHRFSLTGPRGAASGKDAQQGIGGSFGIGKASLVTYGFKTDERNHLLDWWDALKRFCKMAAPEEGIKSPSVVSSGGHSGDSPNPSAFPVTPLDADGSSARSINSAHNGIVGDDNINKHDDVEQRPQTPSESGDGGGQRGSSSFQASTAGTSLQYDDSLRSPESATTKQKHESVPAPHNENDGGVQLQEVEESDDVSSGLARQTEETLKVEHSSSSSESDHQADETVDMSAGDLGRAQVDESSPKSDSKEKRASLGSEPETPTAGQTETAQDRKEASSP